MEGFKYKILLILVICHLDSFDIYGQIKIGDNPTVIDPNSILELESINQGLLMPRIKLISTDNASPLMSHVAGMTVYNTENQNDVLPGFYYNDGTKWLKFVSTGNSTLNTPTVIGTSPANTLSITGLGAGDPSQDEVMTINPITGVLSKIPLSSLVKEEQMIYVALDGQTQFTTPLPITDIDKINVYRNGARIGIVLINANTIELEPGVVCVTNDEIRIVQIN